METGYTRCKQSGCAVFRVRKKPYTISGDNGERDPPVPMPNTEVKPFSADGTWLETTWESRTLPDSMKKGLTPYGVGSFFIPSATFLLSGCLQSMCDIVLGAEIERALRAVQRDEGWNCKGAHSATIAIPGLGE